MIKRIIFTGDLQRAAGQKNNVQFLYHLLESQLLWLTGIQSECFYDIDQFLKIESWVLTERDIDLNENKCWLWNRLGNIDDVLVIGFECPRYMSYQARLLNVPMIEICIHPLRFMSDLVFGVKFNDIKIDNVDESERFLAASHIRSFLSYKESLVFGDKPIIFVGQNIYDRSQVDNGRLFHFTDFIDQLKDLFRNFDDIQYKPHPHYDNTHEFVELFNEFNVKKCEDNIYHVMHCLGGKGIICGLSSSVLYEAPYFQCIPWQLVKKRWWENYSAVSAKHFMSVDFWRKLLDGICEFSDIEDPCIDFGHNYVRRITNSWWGYDFFK